MKYEKEVTEIITELSSNYYEDWMDDSDKKEFKDIMMKVGGQAMSDSIQKGIDMGYMLDFQMKEVKKMFRNMFTDGGYVN